MDWSNLGEITDWSDLSKMMEGVAGSTSQPDSKPNKGNNMKAANEKAKQNLHEGSQDSKSEPSKGRGQQGFQDGAESTEQQQNKLDNFSIDGWTDMKQFDDDHDPDWFEEEENRLAEIYGGHFIKVKYTEQGKPGYFCELCVSEMNAKKSLESHCEGMKHLKKKALWEKNKGGGGDDADSHHADSRKGGWADQMPPRGRDGGMHRDRSPLRRGRGRQSSPPRRGSGQFNDQRRTRPGYGPRHDFNGRGGQFDGPPNDFRGRPDNFRGPSDDFRGPPDDFRGTADDFRGPPDHFQGPPDHFQGLPNNFRGTPDNFRGPPDNFRGPPDNYRGPPDNYRRPPDNFQGPPDNSRGPLDNIRGPPDNLRGPPDNMQGPPDNMQGPPDNFRGPPDNVRGTDNIRGPAVQYERPRSSIGSAPLGRLGGREERSPMPAPIAPPKEKLGGGTTGMLLTKLASCYIKDEEDADLALNVVSSLASSLREYNTKKGEKKIAELLMEAELKLNTLKALKVGLKLLDNKQTPGSAAAAAAAAAATPRYAGPPGTLQAPAYMNQTPTHARQYAPYTPSPGAFPAHYQPYPATSSPAMHHPSSGAPVPYGGQPSSTPGHPPHAQSQMMSNR